MRVTMLTKIGGFRNGEEWPDKGGVIDVPDHEARGLIQARYANPEVPDAQDESPVAEPDGPEGTGDVDGPSADVVDVAQAEPESGDAGELDGLDKRALIGLAAKRGIEVNPRWGADRLRKHIAGA